MIFGGGDQVTLLSAVKSEVCDFCGIDSVAKRYPCKPFKVKSVITSPTGPVESTFESVTDWAACSVCVALIEEMDIEGMLDRHFNLHNLSFTPLGYKESRSFLSQMYEQFFVNKDDNNAR
jgi:hypothetical protein